MEVLVELGKDLKICTRIFLMKMCELPVKKSLYNMCFVLWNVTGFQQKKKKKEGLNLKCKSFTFSLPLLSMFCHLSLSLSGVRNIESYVQLFFLSFFFSFVHSSKW